MGKRAAASGKKAAGADEGKSDDQIINERKEKEAFDLADRFLGLTSWALWALAGLWFMFYSSNAPDLSSVYPPVCEGTLSLLVAGQLCGGLALSSPKGTWSAWRSTWQFCWVPAFVSIGVGILMVAMGTGTSPLGRAPALLWAGGCCLLGVVLVLTLPKGQSSPGKAASAPLARLLLLADAGLALAVASSSLVFGFGTSTHPLGMLTAAVTALPLSLWAGGVGLCSTESEMLSAISSALLLWSGAATRALLDAASAGSVGMVFMALPAAALALAHLALFLPLPADDPESNPFYVVFKKRVNSFTKIMSTDTGGFGDE